MRLPSVVLACAFALLATGAFAQPYSISWYTVDGGGHGPITGGTYSLQGTTGQPDASGALTGGTYSVVGGYWAGLGASTPTVGSPSATAVTSTTATLNANVTSDGGDAITERGFVFALNATNPDPLISGTGVTKVVVSGTTGAFSTNLSSLTTDTTYAFKGYATNSIGTSYSSVTTFVTVQPTLSISDVTLAEGNSGITNAVFTVSLSSASSQTITVSAATANLSAVAGSDYTATGPTTVTFNPTVTTQNVSVPVFGDTTVESDEMFEVILSSPTNAAILDGIGYGTITNQDGTPASRVFVSGTGSDVGDCANQITPCRNLAAAIGQLAVDGEVIVLSPAEYDTAPILIGKGLKITSPAGTVAFIRQPITVNAPGGRVVLRGLTLKGPSAGSGVTLKAADALSVEDTTIDSWAFGLHVNSQVGSNVAVVNSVFLANQAAVTDYQGSAQNRVSFMDSRFERNQAGLDVYGAAATVRQCLFTGNTTAGIIVSPGSVSVRASEFWGNATAVWALSGGTARVSRSHIFGNTTGFLADAGSTFVSSGTNVVRRNTTNTSGTITTVPEQ
jgi:Calx-beta domain